MAWEPLDLAGAVVTFDALPTVRANLDWLASEKKGHYIAVVKRNQPLLYAQVAGIQPHVRRAASGSMACSADQVRKQRRSDSVCSREDPLNRAR